MRTWTLSKSKQQFGESKQASHLTTMTTQMPYTTTTTHALPPFARSRTQVPWTTQCDLTPGTATHFHESFTDDETDVHEPSPTKPHVGLPSSSPGDAAPWRSHDEPIRRPARPCAHTSAFHITTFAVSIVVLAMWDAGPPPRCHREPFRSLNTPICTASAGQRCCSSPGCSAATWTRRAARRRRALAAAAAARPPPPSSRRWPVLDVVVGLSGHCRQ